MQVQDKLLTDSWVTATWDEYRQIIPDLADDKAKGYYYNGRMRIEMSPVSNDHSRDHTIIIVVPSLFAAIKGIAMNGNDNCTYRKTGVQEAQPDVSYYIGENANAVPYGTSVIDLDSFPPPDLVIEVARTSLSDDMGEKRLLYEDLKVKEYWIVDVKNVRVIAFAIIEGGSVRIQESQVLTQLKISLLNEALQRSRQMDQSQVIAWLLTQFQS
jgi:Uma2 family endonuclease